MNYESGTLTISPAEVKLIWSSPTTFIYDGEEKQVTASVDESTIIAGDDVTVTEYTGNKSSERGKHTATATALSNSNYKLPTDASIEWKITKGLEIKGLAESYTYNGKAQKPAITVYFDDEEITEGTDYTIDYTNNINVGTATVTVKPVDGNNDFSETAVNFEITVAEITVTADNAEKSYGEADPEFTATATGLFEGDNIEYTFTRTAGENVGTYEIIPSVKTVSDNYIVKTINNGTFTIKAKENKYGALAIIEDENGKTAVLDDDAFKTTVGELAYTLDKEITVDNVTFTRTFNGSYSTFILPFGIPAGKYSGGKFCVLKDVKYDKDEDKYIAYVDELDPEKDAIEANMPYIFKPTNGSSSLTIQGPITLPANTNNVDEYRVTPAESEHWTFIGTYKRIVWPDGNKRAYGFAGTTQSDKDIIIGDFVRAGKNSSIRPFRCYLLYDQDQLSKSATDLPARIEVRIINSAIDPTKNIELTVIEPAEPSEIENQSEPSETETPSESDDIKTPVSEIVPSMTAKVWSYDKTIYIEAQPDADYKIIDINGRLLRTAKTQSDREEVVLPTKYSGIVIVIIGGRTYKIMY